MSLPGPQARANALQVPGGGLMGRTQRLREAIHTYLGETGEANTTMILDHINNRFRWGATMNQIGNVLARDRRSEKVGFDDRSANGGLRIRVCIWSIAAS